MTDPEVRDPEDTVSPRPDDIAERIVDELDDLGRPRSIETPEADAAEQSLVVEGDDEEYPAE